MAEKIVIAELDIDTGALIKSTQQLKSSIDNLKQSQKELTKEGETASAEYVQNVADLKALSSAYNSNIKAIADSTKAKADEANRTELLNLALSAEVTSIKEAREQNSLLNRLRNEANATTTEGQEEIRKLNNALDANNEFIKENADAYLKQKINIGNYTQSIKDAILNGENLGDSLKETGKGFLGITKSALAFVATPLGAFITLLAGLFALVSNAMSRSEDATNSLTRIFSIFTGVINKVLSALEPLGEFLIDGLVMGFEAVGKIAEKTMGILADALEFVGWDSASESVKGFTEEIKEASKSSQDLADKEAQLEKQQRKTQLIQLQYQKRAEELRQIRDAENVQIKDRIKANEDLGIVLQKQLTEELKIAKLALEVANVKIQQEGKKKDLLDEQYEALTRIADIEERITGQQSEQLVNRNSLLKEAQDKASEQADKRIAKLEEELEYTKELRRLEEESLEELRIIADEEIKILDEKLRLKKISETAYNTEKLRIENDLKEAQKENEEEEIERIKAFEDRKNALLNELTLVKEESEREREQIKLEQDYQKNLAELENLEITELEKTELEALLLENKELVLQGIRDKYNEQNLTALQDYFAKENDVRKKAGDAKVAIERQVASALSGVLGDTLGARLASIAVDTAIQLAGIKTTTAASQAINLAQAAAVAPPPLNIPFISAAGVQNATIGANAAAQSAIIIKAAALNGFKSIASKIKFEKGGIQEIGGKRHSAGGTTFVGSDGTAFEAEKGEGIGILNRSAYSSFMDFNNRFGSGQSSSGFFQGGGIITQGVRTESQNLDAIVEAIQNQPQPIVAVEEIQRVGSQFISVKNMANL